MKRIALLFFITIVTSGNLFSQDDNPIWGIGTKWTFEFNRIPNPNDTFDFAIVEVVDTVTMDGLRLYKCERTHSVCDESFYLYYEDTRVYTYNANNVGDKELQLLYDLPINPISQQDTFYNVILIIATTLL